MRTQAFRFAQSTSLLLLILTAAGCSSEKLQTSTSGTVTVDAEISTGSRFNAYCNDNWAAPERQNVVAGKRVKYVFQLPPALKTLRLDPSEADGSHAIIYSIVFDIPGMGRKALPLASLSGFPKYHCDLKISSDKVNMDATGPDMYFMGAVTPASYPVAE
jgi:hypothetical protein